MVVVMELLLLLPFGVCLAQCPFYGLTRWLSPSSAMVLLPHDLEDPLGQLSAKQYEDDQASWLTMKCKCHFMSDQQTAVEATVSRCSGLN